MKIKIKCCDNNEQNSAIMSVVGELDYVFRTIKTSIWWILLAMVIAMVAEVHSLNGSNVCIVKQKYNVTKRVKYRAPMSVRSYEWCFSMPPRCSRWNTEMRDLTRLETEERVAEMAVCCSGYKMKDVSCVPICPHGKTGHGCSEDCPAKKWGPNCVHDCKSCDHGTCSPVTGECLCQHGWQGESCANIITTTPASMMEHILTNTTKTASASTLETSRTTETLTTKATPFVVTRPTSIVTASFSTESPMPPSTITSVVHSTVTQSSVTQVSSKTTYKSIIETTNIATTPIPYNQTFETTYESIKTASTLSNVTGIFSTTLIPFTIRKSTQASSTTPILTTEKNIHTAVTTSEITTNKPETTRKTESTMKQTTMKFKPKEIWIKPAQKGDTLIDKHKINHEKHKKSTNKDFIPEATTPKTIIVSIIPTSVTYTSFKRIALSTISQKSITSVKSSEEFTRPMSHTTSTPFIIKLGNADKKFIAPIHQNVTKISLNSSTTEKIKPTVSINRNTNSMSTNEVKHLSSNSLTTPSISTNFTKSMVSGSVTKSGVMSLKSTTPMIAFIPTNPPLTTKQPMRARNVTLTQKPLPKVKISKEDNNSKDNLTKTNIETNTVTDDPTKDEETFHILTEPEHITAVMGDKTNEKSSVDLISVMSIAGGVMMSIITVAIVIVMLERCKRPNYEGPRKYNDISMQVMIEKNDVPPPYVRSIFHTPLPDPPTSEKCHYQPISTLDRNLKQFMRPVVVQTISPLMLENFRGILECHYDHLPRRSQDYDPVPTRHSLTPSIEESEKLLQHRCHSITDSTIDALKCEAKLDIIDSTTSEPVYAEIPCWRPPSEQHAVEVINTNGEAVTEL